MTEPSLFAAEEMYIFAENKVYQLFANRQLRSEYFLIENEPALVRKNHVDCPN